MRWKGEFDILGAYQAQTAAGESRGNTPLPYLRQWLGDIRERIAAMNLEDVIRGLERAQETWPHGDAEVRRTTKAATMMATLIGVSVGRLLDEVSQIRGIIGSQALDSEKRTVDEDKLGDQESAFLEEVNAEREILREYLRRVGVDASQPNTLDYIGLEQLDAMVQ